MTATQLQNIPEELRSYPQWVCHDAAKRPINPHTGQLADVTDPTTWGSFDQACAAHDAGRGVGIGFVFTESDPFTGIDLDVPQGEGPSAFQNEIYNRFPSYTETSPSGRGLHIIVKGRVPAAIKDSAERVEVYTSRRHFTVTGNVVRGERPLDMQEGLDWLTAELRAQEPTASHSQDMPEDVSLVSDEDAVAFVRKSDKNRPNWDGEGVGDQSNAFGAIVGALALVGCSREQAKRLALSSPLVVNGPPHSSGTRTEKSARDFDRLWPDMARRGAQERQERAQAAERGRQVAAALLDGWKAQGGAERFRVVHVSDLGDREPSYLIDGLIEERTYNVIYGGPGSGKTFGAIDQSACIATGQDYHGKAVRQGGVVYVLGEGVSGFNRRTKAWAVHNGIALTRDVPLFVVPAPIEMLNSADVNAACDAIAEATAGQTLKLICLDTLARNFGDGDENSTKDMNRFNAAVGNMMDRFSCAVMVVHHSGHDNPNRARGSRSLLGAVDAEFRVDKDHDTVTLTHTKAKDGPEHAPITFGVEFIELGKRQSDGEPFGSLVLVERQAQTVKANKLTSTQQRAMKAFNDAAKDAGQFANDGSFIGLHRDEWRKAFYRIATQDNDDSKSKAFRRACTDLVEKGELEVSDDVFSYAGPFAWVKNQAVTGTRTAGQDTDKAGHVQRARP